MPFYLSASFPSQATLIELGAIGAAEGQRLRLHATFIAILLVVANVAMTFGMLDPALLGYR